MSFFEDPFPVVSPYREQERWYIYGELVNISYHAPNWWKCFHPHISDEAYEDAVQGYSMLNPRVSMYECEQRVRCMSEKKILEYAKYFWDEMHEIYSVLELTDLASLDWLNYID